MQAVILAGGKGTRFLPYPHVLPKPLVPLDQKPILDIIMRQIAYFGFQRITLAVGYMAEMIQAYIRDGRQYGIEIDYAFEEGPLGTAGPLAQIRDFNSTVLVMNGDVITNLDYRELLAFHRRQGAMATIGMYRKEFKLDLDIVQYDTDHQVVDLFEKPAQTFDVSMGIYVFEAEVLRYIAPNKYLDFPDLVQRLLDNDEKVVGYPFNGYWLDIGNRSDYEKAIEDFQNIKRELRLDDLEGSTR